MYKKFKNKSGESILETIIALGILAIGITLASTIIGSSLRNINLSKNQIIAINIAREGIEAMRNIRDTNWLKFSNKRRICWNHNPPEDPAMACDGLTPIEPGDYIIYKQEGTFRWRLGELGIGPFSEDPPIGSYIGDIYNDNENTYIWDGDKWVDITTLYFIDMDINVDSNGDGDSGNDRDAYNHALTESLDALGQNNYKQTVFKRFITIQYLSNDGSIVTAPASPSPDDNRMRITAEVIWQEGKNQFSTQLTTHLTDYLGRETLDN